MLTPTPKSTAEPPRLAPEHPIRRAFYRYGVAAARHWLLFILGSVATAVLLCYPVFFLYGNPTTGSSKLPYHVWTSARLYAGPLNTVPDLEVRQIWVHGSYNKAFEKPVLQEALSIQNTLVRDIHGLEEETASEDGSVTEERVNICQGDFATERSLGLHSPLMFWNCSSKTLQSDTDIVETINSQVTRKSYLNLTLRPASVFASKSFAEGRVVGADALVITVFDRVTENTNRQWDDRLGSLARDAPGRWDLYPRGGHHVAQGQLYEFQQTPLSKNDELALAGSYSSMLGYVVWNLSSLRAVKSWTGLLITLISQASSFLTSQWCYRFGSLLLP